MRTIASTEAKARLNALLAELEPTIINHRRPVAVRSPPTAHPRTFGQLTHLVVPDDFDAPLPDGERAGWTTMS